MRPFGNYTALVTPFKKSGTVDMESLKRLIEFQVESQTDGIVLFGSTGEGHTLTSKEKSEILLLAKSLIPDKIKIIVSILSYSTKDCLKEIKQRTAEGADAFLIAPPPYIKPSSGDLIKHFTLLADQSQKPIILYNIPSRTGASISYDALKVLSLHKNIIGIKEASLDFDEIVKKATLVGNNFSLLCGNDNMLLPFLSLGAKGAVSVIGNISPGFIHTLFELYEYDPSLARKMFLTKSDLINLWSLKINPVVVKHILAKYGKISEIYRKPLLPLSKKEKKVVDDVLKINFEKL